MRHGRPETFLLLTVLAILLIAPAAALGQASATLDLGSLLRERDPETVIGKEE